MLDVFDFSSPLGVLGRLVDALFLEVYMRRLLQGRNEAIRAVATSTEWQGYLSG